MRDKQGKKITIGAEVLFCSGGVLGTGSVYSISRTRVCVYDREEDIVCSLDADKSDRLIFVLDSK